MAQLLHDAHINGPDTSRRSLARSRFGSRRVTPVDRLLPPITLDQLRLALAHPDFVVIDAQGRGGYQRGHLASAINFRLHDDIAAQAAEHVPLTDTPIVLYCADRRCLGAEFVGTELISAGYTELRRFPGGLAAWRAAGFPVVTTDRSNMIPC